MANDHLNPSLQRELTRRRFLALTALGVVGVPAVLEACAQAGSPTPASPATSATPTVSLVPTSAASASPSAALAGPIIVGSRGGTIGQAEKDIIWDAFTKEYGVEVIQFEAPDTDVIIAAQGDAKKVELSYSITNNGGYKTLTDKGYLAEIDYTKFSPAAQQLVNGMPKATVQKYGLADSTIGVNMAYDKRKFPDGGSQPVTWADFWDVAKFPGGRAMYNSPQFTLEVALLADGVTPDALYPLDVERAFKKLAVIKPNVVKWWDAGAQGPQLLIDQEATVGMAYNGRMEAAILSGAPLGYSWDKALTYHDTSIVPANGPHMDTAMAALSFIYEPEIATAIAVKTGYPIPSTVVFDNAPKDSRDRWPNSPTNLPKLVTWQGLWWAELSAPGATTTNLEALTERFNSFIGS